MDRYLPDPSDDIKGIDGEHYEERGTCCRCGEEDLMEFMRPLRMGIYYCDSCYVEVFE